MYVIAPLIRKRERSNGREGKKRGDRHDVTVVSNLNVICWMRNGGSWCQLQRCSGIIHQIRHIATVCIYPFNVEQSKAALCQLMQFPNTRRSFVPRDAISHSNRSGIARSSRESSGFRGANERYLLAEQSGIGQRMQFPAARYSFAPKDTVSHRKTQFRITSCSFAPQDTYAPQAAVSHRKMQFRIVRYSFAPRDAVSTHKMWFRTSKLSTAPQYGSSLHKIRTRVSEVAHGTKRNLV